MTSRSQSMPDDPRKIQLKKEAETSMVFPPNKAFAMSNCPKCQKKGQIHRRLPVRLYGPHT